MHLPDWVVDYLGMTALAAVGSLARGRQWLDGGTGRFLWMKFWTEFLTAIGLSVVVMAWGTWQHVEIPVLCGIAVFSGWLGPEPLTNFLMARFGGPK